VRWEREVKKEQGNPTHIALKKGSYDINNSVILLGLHGSPQGSDPDLESGREYGLSMEIRSSRREALVRMSCEEWTS